MDIENSRQPKRLFDRLFREEEIKPKTKEPEKDYVNIDKNVLDKLITDRENLINCRIDFAETGKELWDRPLPDVIKMFNGEKELPMTLQAINDVTDFYKTMNSFLNTTNNLLDDIRKQ